MSEPRIKPTPSIYELREDVPSALIVVDMQRDWFTGAELVRTAFPQLPANVADLLSTFRDAGAPVVHVRAKYDCPERSAHVDYFKQLNPEKPTFVSLDPEPCAQELPGELVVFKPTFDGFHDTELHAELRRMGVRRVYVCGLVTAACVLNTCFGAFRHGYEVVLVADCTADRSRAQHDAIISIYNGYTFVAAVLAEVQSFLRAPTEEVAAASQPDDVAAVAQTPCTSSAACAAPEPRQAARAGGCCASGYASRHERTARAADEVGADAEPRWLASSKLAPPRSRSDTLTSLALPEDLRADVAAAEPRAPSVDPSARWMTRKGALVAGLSGLACVVQLLAVGLEAVAAGHGYDERLQAPPLGAGDADALRASWAQAAAVARSGVVRRVAML